MPRCFAAPSLASASPSLSDLSDVYTDAYMSKDAYMYTDAYMLCIHVLLHVYTDVYMSKCYAVMPNVLDAMYKGYAFIRMHI